VNGIKLSHTRVFDEIWDNDKRILALRGGARSSKTYSILQAIVFWLISGYFGKTEYKKGTFSIVRETLPALRASAYKDFLEILHLCDFYSKVDHRKTVLEFHYSGRVVQFFSTDDINSAKLRGRQHLAVYFNEVTNISFESYQTISMRTEQFIIMDYNPAGYESWVKSFIEGKERKRGKVNLDISTYFDNIKNLPQPMIDEIEGLKEVDIDLYNVFAKGEWVKSRNLVFSKIHLIKEMPKDYDRETFGVDFGYHDPFVCVRVLQKDKNLYIEQIVYKSKLGLGEIADKLHNSNVGKLYADHDPLQIRELKTRGIRIRKARKGKDSIIQGLGYIRSHKIHVLNTSLDTIREFRSYKYKLDEMNNPTDQVLERDEHSIDATRYALSYSLRGRIKIR